MKTRNVQYGKNIYCGLLLVITLFSSFFNGFSQTLPKFIVGKSPSPILTKAMYGSPRSHGRIGGMDFSQVAVLDPSLEGMPVSIAYNPAASDGSRLEVWIGREKLRTDFVPDWQLLPIAKFADTEYSMTVSIYGKAIHEDTTQIIYHPAFINNLLGWRLLHADIILNHPEKLWQLPQINSSSLLGAGEKAPTLLDSADYLSIASTLRYIMSYSIDKEGPIDSWIYTDTEQKVNIKAECEHLNMSGSPYHYFTDTNYELYYDNLNKYFDGVKKLNTTLDDKTQKVMTELQFFNLALQEEQAKAGEMKQSYVNARNIAMQNGRDTIELWKKVSYELAKSSLRSEEISIELYEFAQENKNILSAKPKLKEILNYSPILEKKFLTKMMRGVYPELLQRLNPPVYQATKNTMQMAAFFRYVKQNNSAAWKKFMDNINAVPTKQFFVQTPYEME